MDKKVIKVHKHRQLYSYDVAIDKESSEVYTDLIAAVNKFYELSEKKFREFVVTYTYGGAPIGAITISKNYKTFFNPEIEKNKFNGTVDIIGNAWFVQKERKQPEDPTPKEDEILAHLQKNESIYFDRYKEELKDGKWDKSFIDKNDLKEFQDAEWRKIMKADDLLPKDQKIPMTAKNKMFNAATKKFIAEKATAMGVHEAWFINTISDDVIKSHIVKIKQSEVSAMYGQKFRYVADPVALQKKRTQRAYKLSSRSVDDGYLANRPYAESKVDIVRCTENAIRYFDMIGEKKRNRLISTRDNIGFKYYTYKPADDGINRENLLDDYDDKKVENE